MRGASGRGSREAWKISNCSRKIIPTQGRTNCWSGSEPVCFGIFMTIWWYWVDSYVLMAAFR